MVDLALICIHLYNEMFRNVQRLLYSGGKKNTKKLMINGEFVIEWKKEKSTPIVLTVDEYETIRLLDKKGYSQEQ